MWRGGRSFDTQGYVRIWQPDHPRADAKGYVYEHILVAERVLGKLPPRAVVHHVNGRRDDNRPANLVVCQDYAYHNLLHMRQRALEGSGHANWLRCHRCHEYCDPSSTKVYVYPSRKKACHLECARRHQRELGRRRKSRQEVAT